MVAREKSSVSRSRSCFNLNSMSKCKSKSTPTPTSIRKKTRKKAPFTPYFNTHRYLYPGSWLERLRHPVPLHSRDCGDVVYLLTASDRQGKLYVGFTPDIGHRWRAHNGILSGGGHAARKWTFRGCQALPVAMIQGFTSRHDALCFEKLVQKLKFKQFKQQVPYQWERQKDGTGKPLKTETRKMLVALRTKRWVTKPLKVSWFDSSFK
ncbi:MAG: hypothetical protein Sylvanvirus30_1, partial [Sylvanvirus sp.]